jgi:hypothetical protein
MSTTRPLGGILRIGGQLEVPPYQLLEFLEQLYKVAVPSLAAEKALCKCICILHNPSHLHKGMR